MVKWQSFFPSRYNFKYKTHDERIINFYSNFECVDINSKSILIIFEGGSGGGFLANCLSFSDKVGSTIDNKLEFLIKKLENMNVVWDDFHLNDIIDNDKHFFILDHPLTKNVLKYHLNKWKSSIVILFKNPIPFCKLRRCVWDVNGEICYDKEYINGEIRKYNKLEKYNDKNQLYSFCDIKSKVNYYIWDVNWYFSQKDTIDNLKVFYKCLNFGELDERSILHYYNVWINKINQLKSIHV